MRANIHKKQFLKVTHYSHPAKSVFNLQLPYLQTHVYCNIMKANGDFFFSLADLWMIELTNFLKILGSFFT